MSENSLSAAIAGNLAAQDDEPPKPKKAAIANDPKPKAAKTKAKAKKSRADTVLIGGHFAPSVAKQLKIIAAEDETTNQALIEEALNLLFVKKGRQKIENL